MSEKTVLEERHGKVLLLTLNRPAKKNAFNDAQYDALGTALRNAVEDDEVSVVVVTGAGDAFSAGQDITEFRAIDRDDGAKHGFPGFMDALCAFDKPLVAAVNGVGVGLGATFLFHCDIVYMSERARLRMPFAELGVPPEAGSSYLLPKIVGSQRAAELLMTAEWIDARRALDLEIAARVLPHDELVAAALARAVEIAMFSTGALQEIKRTLLAARAEGLKAARAREDAGFAKLVGSPENTAALRAFLEKRPA